MFINILLNAKSKLLRVYFVNLQNQKFINKKFDKLYQKSKLN